MTEPTHLIGPTMGICAECGMDFLQAKDPIKMTLDPSRATCKPRGVK